MIEHFICSVFVVVALCWSSQRVVRVANITEEAAKELVSHNISQMFAISTSPSSTANKFRSCYWRNEGVLKL